MDRLAVATLGFRSRGTGGGTIVEVPYSYEADAQTITLEADAVSSIAVADALQQGGVEMELSELSSVIDSTVNTAEAGC